LLINPSACAVPLNGTLKLENFFQTDLQTKKGRQIDEITLWKGKAKGNLFEIPTCKFVGN